MTQHWHCQIDEQGVAWLTLDRKDTKVNSLSQEVLTELNTAITSLIKQPPKGLVIQSGKENGFIAGADINQFKLIKTKAEIIKSIETTHAVFDRISNLPFATVALIKGFCVGGGLELALACDYRLAIDDTKTKLGLPEVNLGIQPGWGGSTRLPQLIGALAAMDLMLTGRLVSAKSAEKMGVVSKVINERYIKPAINHYIFKKPAKRKSKGKINYYLNKAVDKIINLSIIRPLIGKLLTKKVAKKANRKHYPAPFAMIDNWVEYGARGQKAQEAEIKSIAELLLTPTAKNLIRVFFLRERLKGLSKSSNFKPKSVLVIGAGVMGGDIAAWCALSGMQVFLQDQSMEAIAKTLGRAEKLFKKKLKLPHLVCAAKDRILSDQKGVGIANADLIIEAIVEDPKIKSKLFAELESKAKSDAILATNTSTIELKKISAKMKKPERLVGIHFFNPVALMPLVEIVVDTNTKQKTIDDAIKFVTAINKLPLPVKSSPGFVVNRILMPYLLESMALIEEGIAGPIIDRAALEFGMLQGPIELADMVGLDVCMAAAKGIGAKVPEKIEQMVKQGKLGKKSGAGFYKYKKGKVVKPKVENSSHIPEDIGDRLIMRMMNEAVACLREQIVADADLLDAGLIFGAGFAPFTGGPMHYIKEHKAEMISKRLAELEKRYGNRFSQDAGWAM